MQEAKKEIMRLYGGKRWPSFFTRIRLFITAPFVALDKHIPQEGFIVDLGCGYGIFANLLGLLSPKRKILGMDLDGFKMKHADKGIPNVEFRLADITKTDIRPPTATCSSMFCITLLFWKIKRRLCAFGLAGLSP